MKKFYFVILFALVFISCEKLDYKKNEIETKIIITNNVAHIYFADGFGYSKYNGETDLLKIITTHNDYEKFSDCNELYITGENVKLSIKNAQVIESTFINIKKLYFDDFNYVDWENERGFYCQNKLEEIYFDGNSFGYLPISSFKTNDISNVKKIFINQYIGNSGFKCFEFGFDYTEFYLSNYFYYGEYRYFEYGENKNLWESKIFRYWK